MWRDNRNKKFNTEKAIGIRTDGIDNVGLGRGKVGNMDDDQRKRVRKE